MNLGKMYLGLFIGTLILFCVILGSYIIFKYDLFDDDSEIAENQISGNSEVLAELAARQLSNGSWNNDFDTTVVAVNAMTQSVDLMKNHKDKIDWDVDEFDNGTNIDQNEQSAHSAENWTQDNYNSDLPLETQNQVSYSFGIFLRTFSTNVTNTTIDLAIETNDIIVNNQFSDGSWENNIQKTAFSIYVLKDNQYDNSESIAAGEKWLISKEKNHTWGSALNNTFALLALHDYNIDMTKTTLSLIENQSANGSFGDIETTAWAIIALSLYNGSESKMAVQDARGWLTIQNYDELSDYELALVGLAEVEYLNSEVARIQYSKIEPIQSDKGPPKSLVIILIIISGMIVVLLIQCIRVSDKDAMDGVRSVIFKYIKDHPGVNQNSIKRELNISSSSVRHHLKILNKFEYILQFEDGKYIRYYVNRNGYSIYSNGNGYKEIISVLRKDKAANIVKYIHANPHTTQKNLALALNLHPSTIHWYAKLLLSSNIIVSQRTGKSIRYKINEPIDINKLLGLAN